MNQIDAPILASLIALTPLSYVMRIAFSASAFAAAMNVDKTATRAIGFVFLLLLGIAWLVVGVGHGTVLDIILGAVALSAAGYSWWYTRS